MWPKSIGLKLILVVGCILLVSIGIYAYVNIASQKSQLTAEVLRGALRITETVRRSTRNDMLKNQRDDLHQMIEVLGGKREEQEDVKPAV